MTKNEELIIRELSAAFALVDDLIAKGTRHDVSRSIMVDTDALMDLRKRLRNLQPVVADIISQLMGAAE